MTSVGTEFYVILFVICILVTFILHIDVAPTVRNIIIIIESIRIIDSGSC